MSERQAAAARLSELKDGEMKEVSVGETPVLLARVDERCFAVGAHCTHYGAPLAEGALVGDRIICPWHHACFHAATGDVLEPPALDSLLNHTVRIEGDEIYIDLNNSDGDRRVPTMAEPDTAADPRVFVIIGGGAAGYMAAQTLRGSGFKGRIVMLTKEMRLPYDRPNLSKDYLQGHAEPEWMPLRGEEFFTDNGIEVVFGREVTALDADEKLLTLSDGSRMKYDRLLIATGGAARKLHVPGADLGNIFTLRSFDDADSIIAAAENAKRAVIIGASFIGMESASSLVERGIAVTIVAPDKVPFEKTLGPAVGTMLKKLAEEKGVTFRLGEQVAGFEGGDIVTSVKLASGETLPADIVLVGVGMQPLTAPFDSLHRQKDGGILVDSFFKAAEDVYAAGDIAHYPDHVTGERVRIEHWRAALQQGRTAARNMIDAAEPFSSVPFFWTQQFGATLNYVGHAREWDDLIVRGNIDRQDFIVFYVSKGRVLAAAGMNRDREMAELQELMRLGKVPALESLSEEAIRLRPAELPNRASTG